VLCSAADRIAISEVMHRDVTCVSREVTIEALTSLFLERNISAAPVVDADGQPIGIVSKTDLLREPHHARVEDIMMSMAFTLAEDEPLSRAAAVMDAERVHHLPIVGADGRVVGILSSLDFVRWIAGQSAFADQV
jgi:CBS domain-containing protein